MIESKINRAIHDCEFRLKIIQVRIDRGYGNKETEEMKENVLLEIEALRALEKSMRIKDILGNDYDLDRLRELVQAEREGKLLVIGEKIEEAVYTPPADVEPVVHAKMDLNEIKREEINERCIVLKKLIETACEATGLNICVHDGKIGFVDQENWRIVALWEPRYRVPHQGESLEDQQRK